MTIQTIQTPTGRAAATSTITSTVRKTIIAILSVAAMVVLLPTTANETTWECGERSNLPQQGKNYCAAGDFRQSEINLHKVLVALLETQADKFGDASALSNAQNAFETYRDNQCVAENKRIQDKPFHAMIVAQCKTRHTNLRIDELLRMQQKNR